MRRLMPFGKYAFWPIDTIPPSYVRWLRRKCPMDDDLADAFEKVYGGTFKRKSGGWAPPPPPQPTSTAVGPTLQSMRRKFAARYHPDREGGSCEIMTVVNVIFDELQEVLR